MRVIRATNAPIDFEIVDNIVDKLTPEAVASAKRTGCTLKGEFVTGASLAAASLVARGDAGGVP